ncbi:MAG: hypothetical protein OEU97_03830 [Dehalococcoidia bacterium]|nr:hypothetical protein [Dehalococcoidia bacterium]
MRIAAGILMMILSVVAMGIFVYGIQAYYGLTFDLLMILSTAFVTVGGVFCLRRKYWTTCFISSLLVPCFVFLLWIWVIPSDLCLLFIAGAIISAIFTGLRKREWQEI